MLLRTWGSVESGADVARVLDRIDPVGRRQDDRAAKVAELDEAAPRVHEQVGRLHVPVDDPEVGRVEMREGGEGLRRVGQRHRLVHAVRGERLQLVEERARHPLEQEAEAELARRSGLPDAARLVIGVGELVVVGAKNYKRGRTLRWNAW